MLELRQVISPSRTAVHKAKRADKYRRAGEREGALRQRNRLAYPVGGGEDQRQDGQPEHVEASRLDQTFTLSFSGKIMSPNKMTGTLKYPVNQTANWTATKN